MEKESLDVYCYDSYPDFAFGLDRDPLHCDDLNDRKWSHNLAEVRSICPHFGIMEQQSGGNGWTTRMEAPSPRPGQLTLWAMQSVAHGADYISSAGELVHLAQKSTGMEFWIMIIVRIVNTERFRISIGS